MNIWRSFVKAICVYPSLLFSRALPSLLGLLLQASLSQRLWPVAAFLWPLVQPWSAVRPWPARLLRVQF
jgi:hypothetical protein